MAVSGAESRSPALSSARQGDSSDRRYFVEYGALSVRLRRPLTEPEAAALDIGGIAATYRSGKEELADAILAEQKKAARSIVKTGSGSMRVTKKMTDALADLHFWGDVYARQEAARLGIRADRTTKFFAELPPRVKPLETRLRSRLGVLERRTTDRMAEVGLGEASQAAVLRAAARVPGAVDMAGRMVSSGFLSGTTGIYEEHRDLFQGWQYSAVLDEATCDVCEGFDGEEYQTLDELFSVLPDFGPNPDCLGDDRCRCRGVPTGPNGGDPNGDGMGPAFVPPDVASALDEAGDSGEAAYGPPLASHSTMQGPLLSKIDNSEYLKLIFEGDDAGLADALSLDTVRSADVKAARDRLYKATQESLKHRNLPSEFTVYRVGDLQPGTVQSFSLKPWGTGTSRGGVADAYRVKRADVLVDTNAFLPSAFVNEEELLIDPAKLVGPDPLAKFGARLPEPRIPFADQTVITFRDHYPALTIDEVKVARSKNMHRIASLRSRIRTGKLTDPAKIEEANARIAQFNAEQEKLDRSLLYKQHPPPNPYAALDREQLKATIYKQRHKVASMKSRVKTGKVFDPAKVADLTERIEQENYELSRMLEAAGKPGKPPTVVPKPVPAGETPSLSMLGTDDVKALSDEALSTILKQADIDIRELQAKQKALGYSGEARSEYVRLSLLEQRVDALRIEASIERDRRVLEVQKMVPQLVARARREVEAAATPMAKLRAWSKLRGLLGKADESAATDEALVREVGKAFEDEINARAYRSVRYARPGSIAERGQAMTVNQERAKIVAKILSELRDVGPTDERAFLKTLKGNSEAKALVGDAAKLMPREWVDTSAERGSIKLGKSASRGFYRHNTFGEATLEISMRYMPGGGRPGFQVAMHEFGHRVQYTTMEIQRIEQAFYRRRTEGWELQKLNRLKPGYGYGNSEVVRLDDFAYEPYIGRDYGGGYRVFEVTTMGLQELLAGDYEVGIWRNDPDLARFILGLLALL